ncbi:MAG: hypothetical protein M3R51_10525 [Candidatus Eremiobacteraeota bacterium]|nr:hypothetical protein [Candidatus Eremiobacteraeota bacterium]
MAALRAFGYAAATIGIVFCVQAGCSQADVVKAEKPLRWILNGPALANFISDPVSRRFFENAHPFVLERKTSQLELPSSWGALPIRSYTSYRAIEKAFARGTIGPDVRGILYDNEVWKFTPQDEQSQVIDYTRKAAELVHAHGLTFLTAPAVNLVRVLSPASTDKRYDTFLQLKLAGDSARYADVLVIQAQGSESDVTKFRSFVKAASVQAKSANGKVLVLAGISTNPSGQNVSADVVLSAIRATRAAVDGYWFNVPAPSPYCPRCTEFRPDMAIDVLRRLEK